MQAFYEELQGKPLEVVFVSRDRSDVDLKNYLKAMHGHWCYVPFGDEKIKLF